MLEAHARAGPQLTVQRVHSVCVHGSPPRPPGGWVANLPVTGAFSSAGQLLVTSNENKRSQFKKRSAGIKEFPIFMLGG